MPFLRPRLRAAATFGLAVATILSVTTTASAAQPTPSTPQQAQVPAAQFGPAAILPVELPTDVLASTPAEATLAALPDALLPDSSTPGLFDAPADLLPAQIGAFTLPSVVAEALTSAPAPTSVATSLAGRLIRAARSHLGARYVHGSKGPRTFDCIGLVLRSYSQAGLLSKIGGWSNGSGYSLYRWARRHHLTSTSHGQPGDIVVWGGGGHVGIYLGNGRAISALTSGVRIHGIHAVTKRFTAFIHTGLSGIKAKPVPKAKHVNSIGVRHAGLSLVLRAGHSSADRPVSTIKAGAKLTLLRTWRDPKGKLWYRVNANRHVGWVVASFTRR